MNQIGVRDRGHTERSCKNNDMKLVGDGASMDHYGRRLRGELSCDVATSTNKLGGKRSTK
jgi:hypothetical protein